VVTGAVASMNEEPDAGGKIVEQRAIQDQYQTNNYCWGCGRDNEHGLKIKSYWLGEEAVCTWQPEHYHAAGPRNVLNGGIIATLIDCHSACTAMAAAYQAEGREIGTEPHIWCVTASLLVTYLRPTPLTGSINLRARVKELGERKITVDCSVLADGEECARGEVVAVRVPADWAEGQ
jgi:acyl-coenzyme A thioesterase PaaI-like protein